MSRVMRAMLLSATGLLGACTVGPQFHAPATPPVAAGAFVSAAPAIASKAPAPAQWWRLYDDPALDALVTRAFAANTDIRVAVANLAQARAVLAESRSARLPSTTASAGAGYGRNVVATPGGQRAVNSEFYSLGFDMSYELDLYGRVTNSIRAARADADALAAARDAVLVSVAAETTRAYADGCSAARQLVVAQESLKLQSESFDLTERLAQAGRGSPLDVARARAQLESTRATLPGFVGNRRSALFRLAVLTGQPPSQIDPAAASCKVAPRLRKPLPVGDGAALLQRRPDIRQAERKLASATAQIGIQTAALFPQIRLGGSAQTAATSVSNLFAPSGTTFSLGPLISWTFPNITVARARIAQARAGSYAALASFDGVVLTALQETETALSDYGASLDRNAALRSARDQSAEAARIVNLRYRYGAESFLNVLDAERTLANAEAELASSDAALTTNQIAVFKALGGGWEDAGR